MDNVKFRIATPVDADALEAFGSKCFAGAFEHLYSAESLRTFLSETRSKQAYLTLIEDPDCRLTLAETNELGIAGYSLCGPLALPVDNSPPRTRELKRIYVDPAAQSFGIGKQLLQIALDDAEALGANSLFLGVYSENYGAQRFYEREGFTKVGEYGFKVGDHIDHEYIFERVLK